MWRRVLLGQSELIVLRMDTANEPLPPTGATSLPPFSAAFQTLRERGRELLREQSERLRDLEARLEQQFADAIEQLEQEPRENAEEEQELFDRVESLESEIRQLQQLQIESEQALDEARIMLSELEDERRILRERVDELLDASAENAPPPEDKGEVERLERRLEMAMQEVRELKAQNEELAERAKRPAPAATTPSTRPAETKANFDWETQKRRLLEQLESSFDTHDPAQAKEKVRCEDIIRATDRAIQEKDREIDELKRQLEEKESSIETAASQAPGPNVEELLDKDEIIQKERERLAQVQAEWQAKLRQAEVEISIERAKIARERLQLEEKLRTLSTQPPPEAAAPAQADKNAGRGKWLTRLGLSGDEK